MAEAVEEDDLIEEGDIVIRLDGDKFACSVAGPASFVGMGFTVTGAVGYATNPVDALKDLMRVVRNNRPDATEEKLVSSEFKFDMDQPEVKFDNLDAVKSKRWWQL